MRFRLKAEARRDPFSGIRDPNGSQSLLRLVRLSEPAPRIPDPGKE